MDGNPSTETDPQLNYYTQRPIELSHTLIYHSRQLILYNVPSSSILYLLQNHQGYVLC